MNALVSRYRPRSLSEVFGQDYPVRVLSQLIKTWAALPKYLALWYRRVWQDNARSHLRDGLELRLPRRRWLTLSTMFIL